MLLVFADVHAFSQPEKAAQLSERIQLKQLD